MSCPLLPVFFLETVLGGQHHIARAAVGITAVTHGVGDGRVVTAVEDVVGVDLQVQVLADPITGHQVRDSVAALLEPVFIAISQRDVVVHAALHRIHAR